SATVYDLVREPWHPELIRPQRPTKRYISNTYPRLSMSDKNHDALYTPRIEDDSLLYLAFDVQAQRPVVMDLAEDVDEDNHEQENAVGILHVLAISLLLFVGRQLILILFMALARENRQDGA
ncbi:hypothetical protein V5O48_018977, partial [Marasmius crinis-equi]